MKFRITEFSGISEKRIRYPEKKKKTARLCRRVGNGSDIYLLLARGAYAFDARGFEFRMILFPVVAEVSTYIVAKLEYR